MFDAIMERAQSSRARVGAIEIVSPLGPTEVVENLRLRGKEWRESAVPEELRKLSVTGLVVTTSGSSFTLYWLGNIGPFYNPFCFGSVEPAGNGSRIVARFKLNTHGVVFAFFLPVMLILHSFTAQSPLLWVALAVATFMYAFVAGGNRGTDLLRARLIEVLATAAQTPVEVSRREGQG
jgi:hypothetical protein